MTNLYIQLAARGQIQGWRYFLGTFLSLFLFAFGSSATLSLLFAYVNLDGDPSTQVIPTDAAVVGQLPLAGVPALWIFIAANLAFPCFLLGIYASLRWLHQRSFLSIVTPSARVSWRRVFQGFFVFALIKVLEILVSYLLNPADFRFVFQPSTFLVFVPFVLVLTSIQTATEELFFRGYLLQGTGFIFGKWIAVIVSSLLFTLLHAANSEVLTQDNATGVISLILYYFMTAAFLAWLTLKDATLELAMGVHAANNIVTFLLVTSPNSVIPSPALFEIRKMEAGFSLLLTTALSFWLFSYIVFRLMRRPVI